MPAQHPRRLHAEGCLKIGFRAGRIAQHQDARPRRNRYACGQLAARQGNCFALQRFFCHRFLHGRQRIHTDARIRPGRHNDFILMEKHVFATGEQIFHGKTGSHVGQKPKRMQQVIQQIGIGKRHFRLSAAHFQRVFGNFRQLVLDKLQPFLHFVFINEFRQIPFSRGAEKLVQIKFVKLALARNIAQTVGQLIRHHHHFRQRCIRIGAV